MPRVWLGYLAGFILLLNLPLSSNYFHGNSASNAALYCDYFRGLIGCNPPNNLTLPLTVFMNLIVILLIVFTYRRAHLARMEIDFRRVLPILIQGSVQLSIFYYVIAMNPQIGIADFVKERMPFIFYQIIFAFSFDYLFTLWRGKVYYPKFYVIPMVLSFNLFIWFSYDFSIFHSVIIILGVLIKTFIVREEPDGTVVHIFNPSFISLTPVSIVIMALGLAASTPNIMSVGLTAIYDTTPHFNIFVFCVGCITLWLPNSYVESIGAYSIIMFLDYLSRVFLGYHLFFGLAAGSVMIAVMLGITDPKTSPKTSSGKFIFGVAYGLSLTFFYFAFAVFNVRNAYFSKIFAIPLLNYFSRKFDDCFALKLNFSDSYFASRFISIAIFTVIFAGTYPILMSSLEYPVTLASLVSDQIRAFFGVAPFYNNAL